MARLRKFQFSENWYIVWRDDRSHRLSTGTRDKNEAERQLARFVGKQNAPPEEPIINDIIEGYLAFFRGQQRRWYRNREYEMSALRSHFGLVPPRLVAAPLVRSFITKRQAGGANRSTVDRQLRALRACLSWGVKNGWIDKAPYIETPGGNPPRDRWLTRGEADSLILGCRDHHVRLFVLVALHTGARTRPILDLTWDRVDLDRGVVLYPPAAVRSRKRTAVVPLTETLARELEEARKAAGSRWVIEHRGRPVQSIKTGFRAAVRRAGLKHCTPHDLRRTCATWMVQDGIPLAQVARFLGDTEEMIEKVYGQHSPDYLRDAARSLEG